MRVVQVPSTSKVKLAAVTHALGDVWPGETFDVRGFAVDLQDNPDYTVNAQPEGLDQTVGYARARRAQMYRQHHAVLRTADYDISIESGVIDGEDVAVAAIYMPDGREIVTLSQAVAFPEGVLEEARRRGLKTITAGDIIHEQFPDVPSNAWQGHAVLKVGGLSREEQIRDAVMRGLQIVKNR